MKRIVSKVTLFSVLSFCFFAPSSLEAQIRIATVDVARILNESPKALLQKKRLDQRSAKLQTELEEERDELRGLESEARDSSDVAKKYRSASRDFARKVKDAEEDLKSDFLDANRRLTAEVLTIIEDYSKEEGIDLVLNKSEASKGPVLFATKMADITDKIIERVK